MRRYKMIDKDEPGDLLKNAAEDKLTRLIKRQEDEGICNFCIKDEYRKTNPAKRIRKPK